MLSEAGFGLPYSWDPEEARHLKGEARIIPTKDLELNLDYPVLQSEGRWVNPREVLDLPHSHPWGWAKTMRAEEAYAIIVVQHPSPRGHWVVLDGIYRLMKAVVFKKAAVKCKVISWPDFMRIASAEK